MKRIVVVMIITMTTVLRALAMSCDEKIANAMNASDWFTLDSIYKAVPKDSISPFLEVFSRCLIGNRLNQPDVSIPAFQELLNSHTLDVPNLVSSTYMFGMDLSRKGLNAEAASMIESIVSQTGQYMDSLTINGLEATAARYSALSLYNPYQIGFPDTCMVAVPFAIVPVGPPDKGGVLMHLVDCTINGKEADVTFDTGAGTNMITHEMAAKYNLIPLEGTRQTVLGVGRRDGYIAIAKELSLGDLIIKDVPFTVISLSTDNEEADKYIDCYNIVIGSELMLQLKNLTIDFINRQITIPTEPPTRSDATPNMCFSNGMNLLTHGMVRGIKAFMCIDSGDASFGYLSSNLFEKDKEYVERVGRPDTIRSAGVGGVSILPCYYVPDIPVDAGGTTVVASDLVVKTQPDGANDVNLGVRALMMFGKLHFNMVDFVLTAEPPARDTSMNGARIGTIVKSDVPTVRLSKPRVRNMLETIGFIGVAVANGLLNPNAPAFPDL